METAAGASAGLGTALGGATLDSRRRGAPLE
jgi:hypothetical protein